VAVAPHRLSPERKILPVLDALRERYGDKVRSGLREPLAVLVRGVLSQNTSDANSGRAFGALMAQFGDWPGVAAASRRQIARAIVSGGLAEQKARTIHAIMQWLGERGAYSLEFLEGLGNAEAERLLTRIKGVGIKTARLTLLFGLGRPIFVVDTHVHRVSRRLGLIPAKCGREKAHVLLDTIVPDEQKYSGHMNIIEHGRRTCRSRSPLCDGCCVRRWCLYVRGIGATV
jgi:endonuclease-3